MNPAADALFEAAQQLLDVAAAAIAADAPGGPIDYQAVWPGLPAFDCAPSLHVNLQPGLVGNTLPSGPALQELQRIVTTGQVNLFTYTITMLRCVATVESEGQNVLLPPPSEITTDARICYGDLWAVWNGVKNAHRVGALFQVPSGRREFGIGPATAVRTAGGVGGFILPVTVQIPGYNADAQFYNPVAP